MTGADIIARLLLADAPTTAFVASANIKTGRLPDDALLPALLVRTVSVIEQQTLLRAGWERMIARVSVAARAASYRDKNEAIRLVRACCAGRTGDIGGALRVAIRTAGLGPDLDGPGNTFEQTQDFRVSFDAPV